MRVIEEPLAWFGESLTGLAVLMREFHDLTAGDPAMTRLRDGGAAQQVRAAHDWTAAHLGALSAQLSRSA